MLFITRTVCTLLFYFFLLKNFNAPSGISAMLASDTSRQDILRGWRHYPVLPRKLARNIGSLRGGRERRLINTSSSSWRPGEGAPRSRRQVAKGLSRLLFSGRKDRSIEVDLGAQLRVPFTDHHHITRARRGAVLRSAAAKTALLMELAIPCT